MSLDNSSNNTMTDSLYCVPLKQRNALILDHLLKATRMGLSPIPSLTAEKGDIVYSDVFKATCFVVF